MARFFLGPERLALRFHLGEIDFDQNIDHGEGPKAKLKWESVMSHFIVKFMKDVIGDNGHQAEICQRAMDIDANNEQEARALAESGFCKMEGMPHWSLRADRIQIKEADFPS